MLNFTYSRISKVGVVRTRTVKVEIDEIREIGR